MTTEQITLAHTEHSLWLDLWKQLLALKAITEDDLKKTAERGGFSRLCASGYHPKMGRQPR